MYVFDLPITIKRITTKIITITIKVIKVIINREIIIKQKEIFKMIIKIIKIPIIMSFGALWRSNKSKRERIF